MKGFELSSKLINYTDSYEDYEISSAAMKCDSR